VQREEGVSEPTPVHPLGHCPLCGAPGKWRERRPGGNDGCANFHRYPSADAVPCRCDEVTPPEEGGAYWWRAMVAAMTGKRREDVKL
jgi:hypothetical protein